MATVYKMPSLASQHHSSTASLLTLPSELRHQIYTYLFPSSTLSHLILRSLFIRTYYRNIYMTQQPKNLTPSLPLLRVCQQITTECLPILYASPQWNCGARIEELGSQIGFANFARIRRMSVVFEDLGMVVLSLEGGEAKVKLRFDALEVLEAEGYQASALVELDSRDVSAGLKRARFEALRLCKLAKRILSLHPNLNVLLQRDENDSGGADAMDMTLGRVKWRFVKNVAMARENEHAADLDHVVNVLTDMLEDPGRDARSSVPASSLDNGQYKQYPYLLGQG